MHHGLAGLLYPGLARQLRLLVGVDKAQLEIGLHALIRREEKFHRIADPGVGAGIHRDVDRALHFFELRDAARAKAIAAAERHVPALVVSARDGGQ